MRRIPGVGILISFFVLGLYSWGFSEENLTITTYYPSPNGVYSSMETEKLAVGDINNDGRTDSSDVPAVAVSGQAFINTSLSIGTTNSLARLHIKQAGENMLANEWWPGHAIQVGGVGSYLMLLGVDSSRSGAYIESVNSGVGQANLCLNPNLDNGFGRVGIGTTSPQSELHIRAGRQWGGNADVQLQTNNGAQSWNLVSAQNNGQFRIYDKTRNLDRLVIDTAGKVGIGTATPSQTLSVQGVLSISNNLGSEWWIDRETASGALTFTEATKGEYMRLTEWPSGDGYLGIGTTNPTSKLHVVGLRVFANNAAALAGNLTAGAFYRTGGDPDHVCVVH